MRNGCSLEDMQYKTYITQPLTNRNPLLGKLKMKNQNVVENVHCNYLFELFFQKLIRK
jgi:hypothetical protein